VKDKKIGGGVQSKSGQSFNGRVELLENSLMVATVTSYHLLGSLQKSFREEGDMARVNDFLRKENCPG